MIGKIRFALEDGDGDGLGSLNGETADHDLLEVTGPLDPAIRPVVLAAGAGVDLALKQDARELN